MNEEIRDPAPWSARVVDTLTENPYFSVLLQDVTVTDGSKRTYYTIHFPGPAVGVIARRGESILLIRQYRFIVDSYVWAIPSGGVTAGESAEEAARRELEEETGYAATRLQPLFFAYASYGCSNQRFELFLADDVEPVRQSFDRNEVIDARWFTRDEVAALIKNNGIVDNLSLSPLLHVLLFH